MTKHRLTTVSIDKKRLEKTRYLANNDDRSMVKYLHRLIDREYENLQKSKGDEI